MISSSSDSCTKLVAGKYDVLLDENPAQIRRALNGYLERFGQLELLEHQHQQASQKQVEENNNNNNSNNKEVSSYADSGYLKEFMQLRELSNTLKLDRDNLREGELDCNQRKNRYQDIIPFNHTRVVLNNSMAGLPEHSNGVGNRPGSDYINANFISGSSGSHRAYIACQGPLKRTLNQFWRMIWECNVSVIIMACNEYESGQLKCEHYWPELPNTSCLYGQFEVTLVKVRQICDDFLIRKFSVKLLQNIQNQNQSEVISLNKNTSTTGTTTATDSGSSSSSVSEDGDRNIRSDGDSDSYHHLSDDTPAATMDHDGLTSHHRHRRPAKTNNHQSVVLEERTICQFHYTTWPDHGVPQSVQPILELLRLVRDVQPAEDKPILVHCSAGCGRTGTICCIDYVWGLLRRCRLEPDFDLYHIISEMRRQRMSMVQTLEQYILCHRAVAALFADQLSIMLDDEDDNDNIYGDDDLDTVERLEKTAYEDAYKQEDIDEKAFDEDEEDFGPVFI